MAIALGALGVLIGTTVLFDTWYEASRFQGSPEAEQAQRGLEAPQPIWIAPDEPITIATQRPVARPPLDLRAADRADDTSPPVVATTVTPPEQRPQLELAGASFRFLDPPEPGARARLEVDVHNLSDTPSGPFQVTVPLKWLAGYKIDRMNPAPSMSREVAAERQLTFDTELPPGESEVVEVVLVAVDEVLDAPALRVLDGEGREVGRAQPRTEAPHPRPGPVWSVALPRLNIRAGVVPVDWEPPLFVVGQLRTSSKVSEGNAVLIGHLVGSLGNVFQHLDRVTIGDEVIATSRGEEYRFVVSQKELLPADDATPTQPTDSPRLTLMTCAGAWNPLTRDYAERLWVIAEPPELAAVTIASGAPAPRAQPTATPVMPTPAAARTPLPVSPPGGLGNTDTDVAAAFGAPIGEATGGLAVYHTRGLEYRAAYADAPDGSGRRALLVARVAAPGVALSLDEAVKLARPLLPRDAVARRGGPEGNARFVVERFTSASLAAVLPAEWFDDRHAEAGEFLVVYPRQPDGSITDIVVGIGIDAEGLLRPLAR